MEDLVTYGFLVAVDLKRGGTTTPQRVSDRIHDGLQNMHDIDSFDVTTLGEITVYPNTEGDEDGNKES